MQNENPKNYIDHQIIKKMFLGEEKKCLAHINLTIPRFHLKRSTLMLS